MYYEINVAKKSQSGYSHFFATNPRSIETKEKLKILVKEFAEKFPTPEFKFDVTLHPEQSFLVRIDAIINQ